MNNNLPYLLALHSIDGLGPIRLKKILEYFKDPALAWNANENEIQNLGIPINVIEKLKQAKRNFDPEKYLTQIKNDGIKILTIFDDSYPKRLKEIYDPPLVLFYKGEILPGDDFAIGVVGTRKVTGYGKMATSKLTEELIDAGFTIVSGLARGVDTIAHQTTVNKNGRTLAVLGGGIKTVFPPENNDLARKIADGHGAYMSEFPPDYPHLPGNFPSRNRIISGLSKAVLVTEAAEDSGSLITARLALEQGREVFAVPGPINSSLSKGPADLIKEGARLTFDIQDILDELGVEKSQILNNKDQITNLSDLENHILEMVKDEGKHIDEICRFLKEKPASINAALMKMEIMGVVKNLGGGVYTRSI